MLSRHHLAAAAAAAAGLPGAPSSVVAPCAPAPPISPQLPACGGAGPAATAAAPAKLAVRLAHSDTVALDALLDRVSTIILDQDGVLWRGTTLMPGTAAALQAFRRRGKRLLFLTNNSSRSRAQYKRKFDSLGLHVQPEEIVPTRWAGGSGGGEQGLYPSSCDMSLRSEPMRHASAAG